jgi:hypothetical protein
MADEQGPTRERGHPRKRQGETFSSYWQRLTDEQAIAFALASRRIAVTPQSLFVSYIRTDGEE